VWLRGVSEISKNFWSGSARRLLRKTRKPNKTRFEKKYVTTSNPQNVVVSDNQSPTEPVTTHFNAKLYVNKHARTLNYVAR
jgi:hypothetical protein